MFKLAKMAHQIRSAGMPLRLAPLGLGVLLLFALVAGAYGQAEANFTGKVATAATQVADGKFQIVLRLAEYPDYAFYIDLKDAPKFGLAKDQEIKSGAEFGQFMGNLDALKGRTVKLSCVKMAGESLQYQVKALERMSRK
jgi:hypothetical protein